MSHTDEEISAKVFFFLNCFIQYITKQYRYIHVIDSKAQNIKVSKYVFNISISAKVKVKVLIVGQSTVVIVRA